MSFHICAHFFDTTSFSEHSPQCLSTYMARKIQVMFRKRATNYRALLRKMSFHICVHQVLRCSVVVSKRVHMGCKVERLWCSVKKTCAHLTLFFDTAPELLMSRASARILTLSSSHCGYARSPSHCELMYWRTYSTPHCNIEYVPIQR